MPSCLLLYGSKNWKYQIQIACILQTPPSTPPRSEHGHWSSTIPYDKSEMQLVKTYHLGIYSWCFHQVIPPHNNLSSITRNVVSVWQPQSFLKDSSIPDQKEKKHLNVIHNSSTITTNMPAGRSNSISLEISVCLQDVQADTSCRKRALQNN